MVHSLEGSISTRKRRLGEQLSTVIRAAKAKTYHSISLDASSRAIVNGTTEVYGVIGDPIAYSLSPPMHNAAFRSLGMDCVYVPFLVRANELASAIQGIKSLGILGINVKMPHKERILPLLDRIDVDAKEIGAVNTVIRTEKGFDGYNTDGPAALDILTRLRGDLSGSKALVLGAGGAARAIVYYLSKTAEQLVILNRTASKATDIAAKSSNNGAKCRGGTLDETSVLVEMSRADIVVNCLPAGVFSRFDEALLRRRLIRQDMIFFDANYEFRNDFLAEARLAGAKVTDGFDLVVGQAALSFRLFTGREPPVEAMREAATLARSG